MSLVTVETTTTRTTTTWRRRRPPAWLLLLPLLGLLLLLAVGLTAVRDRVETDLATRAAQALADDGVPVGSVSVDFTGRDGLVGGTVEGAGAADEIAATVAGVEGVRTVDASSLVLADAAASDAGDAGTATATPAELLLSIGGDQAVLTGTVGSAVTTDALAAAAGVPAVLDETRVEEGSGDATGGTVRLVGEVADDATRGDVVAAAQDLVGPSGAVVDELTVATGTQDGAGDEPSASEAPGATTPSVDGTGEGTATDPWIAFFNTGETIVRDFEDSVAEALEVLPGVPAGTTVQVIGYADPRGNPETNRELSLQRAEAVADELRTVAPDLVYEVDARGSDQPAATDALSRRVEFFVDGG